MIATSRRLGALAAGAAVVLAVTLSGCDSQAGAAAVIGDRRIPVSDVQHGYSDVVRIVGQDAQVSQSQVLALLILEPYLTKAAAGLGRGVSDEDVKLDISAGSVDAADIDPAGLEVWRANLASTALQTDRSTDQIDSTYQGIEQQLKRAGVHINPRFGSGIDYSTFTITQSSPNWLKAAATPVAAEPAPAQPTEPSPTAAP